MRTKSIWTILMLLYVAFFSWYTSFGGPLTSEEIDAYFQRIDEHRPNMNPEGRARLRLFLEADTGDDFVMVNVIEMHETPLQLEGVEPGETSEEVLAKYMEYMTPALFARACHPVFYGAAAGESLEMFGMEGVRQWTTGAGMRYRSRRDLMDIASNPAFQGSHEFKIAAMKKTFAFPVDPWLQLGDPRLLLALFLGSLGLAKSWFNASRSGIE